MNPEDKVRCSFCSGSLPADDSDGQVEHMFRWHGASNYGEAKVMADKFFHR